LSWTTPGCYAELCCGKELRRTLRDTKNGLFGGCVVAAASSSGEQTIGSPPPTEFAPRIHCFRPANEPSNASTLSVWGQDFGFAPAFSVVRLLLLFCQAKGKLPLLLAAQTSPALCPVRPCPTYLTFRQAGMYSARPYLISLLCSPPMCSKTMAGHGRAGQYAASGSHRPFFHPTSRDRVHQLKSLGLQRFTTPL